MQAGAGCRGSGLGSSGFSSCSQVRWGPRRRGAARASERLARPVRRACGCTRAAPRSSRATW
eukprot:9017777-Pyramimonas_sp.AAC.1